MELQLQTVDLATVSGIVLATIGIVQMIKAQFGNTRWLKEVPVIAYVVLVSGALTFAANQILGTIDGDFGALCVQVLLQSLTSAGFFVLPKAAKKLDDVTPPPGDDKGGNITLLLLLILVPLLALSGCVTTPRGKLYQANLAIDTLNKTYAEAVYAGWLTDEQVVKFGNAIGALSEAADLAQQMQDEGSLDGSILQQINDGIALVRRRLIEEIERNQKNERAIGTGVDWYSASRYRPGDAMGNHREAAWGNLATAV